MKDIIKIMLGNIFITISYAYLIVPYKIINGGVTSSALILHVVTGMNIAVLANIVTILLLLLCFVFLGKEYLFKSILSSCCYMLFFNFFYAFKISVHLNIIAIIIIASVLLSIGYYLCITANASTVGYDVIALILHHKNKKIEIAVAIRCINLIILFIGLSVYGLTSIISGIVFTFVYSYILGKLLSWNPWGRS
ncbi:YitT family protein, partial [Bacillus xiapuensis]|nr:YitT family protein [Bacillus xiapuensis]